MPSIVRVIRAACLLGLLALAAAAPASAQTAVTADAVVWFTSGAPADSAARVVARVDDPSANPSAVMQTLTTYLPKELTLDGSKLPSCALATIRDAWVEGCSAGSQVGSGRVVSLVGPQELPVTFDAYLINGTAPGELLVALAQSGGRVWTVIAGQVGPSDDPAFGSMLTFTVPAELRRPGGLDNAITEIDLLLRNNAAVPYVAIAGCPLGALSFKGLVTFAESDAGSPPAPIQVGVNAGCMTGPPLAVLAMPRSASSPADVWPVTERAAASFGVKLNRVRRLQLTGLTPDAAVSARCLRRCGKAGKELIASVRGSTARLKQPLRPRSRFELRIGGDQVVTRFARYEVNRRRTAVRRIVTGCLDDAGAVRPCPPTS